MDKDIKTLNDLINEIINTADYKKESPVIVISDESNAEYTISDLWVRYDNKLIIKLKKKK